MEKTLSEKRLYRIWMGMRARCNNPKNKAYQWYGSKGIKVSEIWLDFKEFQKWSFSNNYGDTLTIDRIDSNKGYDPSNCRWVTRSENSRNICRYPYYSDTCKRGHPRTPENTYIYKGNKDCLKCVAVRSANYDKKNQKKVREFARLESKFNHAIGTLKETMTNLTEYYRDGCDSLHLRTIIIRINVALQSLTNKMEST